MRHIKPMTAIFVFILLGVSYCSMGLADTSEDFIPGEDSGFYYIIKKGDTLWDLSQKFYNSQWDWPGLWEMNDEIKNPHLIYPGKKIRIFLKEKSALKPKIVEVQKLEKKAAQKKVDPSFSFSEMDHVAFLKETAQESYGTVIKEQEGNLMMSKNDIIYIKPSGKGTLIPGKTYHVFATSTVEDKINDKKFTGILHLIKAKIKILEHKTSYVTGVLMDTYIPVNKGDFIMPYYHREAVLKVQEHPDAIDSRIICSDDNHLMINDYRIAFIDMGKDMVKPGQIYSVLRKNEIKDNSLWPSDKKDDIQLENLLSGKLIVLHCEDISSTVMILSSKYAIHPNDIVN